MSKPDICVISKRKARDLVHSGQAKEIGPVRDKFTGIIYQSLYWKTKDLVIHHLLRLPDDSYRQASQDS